MDMRNIFDIIFWYDIKNLKFHRRDYMINTTLVLSNTFFTLQDNLGVSPTENPGVGTTFRYRSKKPMLASRHHACLHFAFRNSFTYLRIFSGSGSDKKRQVGSQTFQFVMFVTYLLHDFITETYQFIRTPKTSKSVGSPRYRLMSRRNGSCRQGRKVQ